MLNQISCGDCLELIKQVEPQSVSMVLTDLPYGGTKNSWDEIIPFDKMWEALTRVCSPFAAKVFTASQPFTSKLVMSNIKEFRHEWIWEKNSGSNYLNLGFMPFKLHENIVVFAALSGYTFNRQPDQIGDRTKKRFAKVVTNKYSQSPNYYNKCTSVPRKKLAIKIEGENPASSIQFFSCDEESIHPTQKPVALFEYLIKTYSNEGDVILDLTAGLCTTAIAAHNLNRRWICFEKDPKYYALAEKRVKIHTKKFVSGNSLKTKGLEGFFE